MDETLQPLASSILRLLQSRAPSAFPEYQMTKYIFVSKCIVFLHNFVLCIGWQRDFISGIISYPSLLSVCQMNINTSVGLRIASYLFKAIPTSFQRVLFKFLSDTLVPTERSRQFYFCDEFGSKNCMKISIKRY